MVVHGAQPGLSARVVFVAVAKTLKKKKKKRRYRHSDLSVRCRDVVETTKSARAQTTTTI